MDLLTINMAFLVLAIVAFLAGMKFLLKKGWIKGFLRGSVGLLMLGMTFVLVSSSLNLSQFSFVTRSDTLATLSVQQVSTQVYSVTIKAVNSEDEIQVNLIGDLFQVGAEKMGLPLLGGNHLLQLTQLKTKYYSIEQQESKSISNFSLKKDSYGINLWDTLTRIGFNQAVQPKTTPFYAMKDGEMLSLKVHKGGLVLTKL